MQSWSEEEVERTLEEIRKLSIVDSEFRQLALTQPATAVARVNPHPLPEGYQVRFIDNSGLTKSFVLPDPVDDVLELSDAELEAIAGGTSRNNNVTIPA